MGCGASKDGTREPSRIQTVVVNVGSPKSHLKAHEAAQQQNHGLVNLIGTQSEGPFDEINNIEPNNSLLQSSTVIWNHELQPFVESSQTKDGILKHEEALEEEFNQDILQQILLDKSPCNETPRIQQLGQDSPLFYCNNGVAGSPLCDKSPQVQEVVLNSPLLCSSNGLVGTLAGLDEILGVQEADSLKLAIKVTAEKIMRYGGVLHSLEDQVGTFSYPSESNEDTLVKLESQEGQEHVGLNIENYDGIESPTITRCPQLVSEGFPKKLPPILTPPNSSMIDKSSMIDPFVKTPFPSNCQTIMVEIQDLTEEPPLNSPQLPQTTKMVSVENVKDSLVMDGVPCNYEEGQIPQRRTLLESLNCYIDKIILLETLGVQETIDTDYDLHIDRNENNMSLSNLIPKSGEKNGVNMNSPLDPFSICSPRIEYLSEGDVKPLSSDEFYS